MLANQPLITAYSDGRRPPPAGLDVPGPLKSMIIPFVFWTSDMAWIRCFTWDEFYASSARTFSRAGSSRCAHNPSPGCARYGVPERYRRRQTRTGFAPLQGAAGVEPAIPRVDQGSRILAPCPL